MAERLEFYEDNQLKLLRMSYVAAESSSSDFCSSEREVDMYIFLPRERFGLGELVNALTAKNLILAMLKCRNHDVNVSTRTIPNVGSKKGGGTEDLVIPRSASVIPYYIYSPSQQRITREGH